MMRVMGARLDDLYFSQDFPVLGEIGRWEAAGRAERHLMPETIAGALNRPRNEVIQSLGRLSRAGLVNVYEMSTTAGENFMVQSLTRAGLQESGLYPKPADLSAALEEALKREIQATAKTDPARSEKLKFILDTLKEVGPQVIGRVVEAILKAYGVGT